MAPRAPGPIVLPPPPALKSQIIFTKLRKQFNSQKMSKFRQLNSKFQYLISKEYSSFWPGGVRGGGWVCILVIQGKLVKMFQILKVYISIFSDSFSLFFERYKQSYLYNFPQCVSCFILGEYKII